jgi:hypothetical protein
LGIQPGAINVHGGAQGVTSFDQFVPKASIPEIQQRFLTNMESIKQ